MIKCKVIFDYVTKENKKPPLQDKINRAFKEDWRLMNLNITKDFAWALLEKEVIKKTPKIPGVVLKLVKTKEEK